MYTDVPRITLSWNEEQGRVTWCLHTFYSFLTFLYELEKMLTLERFQINSMELKVSYYADDGYFIAKTVDSVRTILR